MRAPLKILAILLFIATVLHPTRILASESTGGSPALSPLKFDRVLLREVLRASGVSDLEKRQAYEAAFQTLLHDVTGRIGTIRSRYRMARKLHELLHQQVLRRYQSSADGLDVVLDHGDYNCLSASLLYGLLGRALGLQVQVVEIPSHVYVRILVNQRKVEVETTSRNGFDLRQEPLPGPGTPGSPSYGANAGAAVPPGMEEVPDSVELERAVGFLWHNTGRRALEHGEALRAAESFLEESKLEPLEASRTETVGMFLARAFRLDYEAGNFGEAYRIAEIGMEVFPGQTTARDRMLAATLKRIEGACEAGQADAAEEILNQAAASVKSPVDIRRLERGSCPTIAAAAVRAEDWERAGRMALRFNAAELDGVESRRLSRWVARRQREAQERERENACSEVPANSYESPLLSVVDLPTPAASSPGSAD